MASVSSDATSIQLKSPCLPGLGAIDSPGLYCVMKNDTFPWRLPCVLNQQACLSLVLVAKWWCCQWTELVSLDAVVLVIWPSWLQVGQVPCAI